MYELFKKPSSWIPIVLSLGIIGMEICTLATFPAPSPNADEGVAAHLFQIWLVLEVVLIVYFALRRIPQKPAQALPILLLQILGVVAGCFPVWYFHL